MSDSVSPALFIAGWSLTSNAVQRVFALVELLRAVAAFMIAPVLMHLAKTVGANPKAGSSIALWICLGLAMGGLVIGICLYVLGRARPQAPDLETWLEGDAPAWESPPLLAAVRGDAGRQTPGEVLQLPGPSRPGDLGDRLVRRQRGR